MSITSNACWFLLIKTLLQKNKKGDAALKNEASGDEKHVLLFYLALCYDIFVLKDLGLVGQL